MANLGVLAGIVFLGIEVRQNQASLEDANIINRATATTAAVEYINEYRNLLLQDEDLREVFVRAGGDEQVDHDAFRFQLLCQNGVWTMIMLHERYEMLGLHDRAHGTVGSWIDTLQHPGMRECWERQKPRIRAFGYDSFVDAVESFRR